MTSTTVPSGPKSMRGEQTRRRIVEAAMTLFAERGERAVSMRQVAAAAGLSAPGVLRHFPSKEELLMSVVSELDDDGAAIARLANGDALECRDPAAPTYDTLRVAIAGQATSISHPAHSDIRARYACEVERLSSGLIAASSSGTFHESRGRIDAARLLIAARDGLRLVRAYLGEHSGINGVLVSYRRRMAVPSGAQEWGFRHRHPDGQSFTFNARGAKPEEQEMAVGGYAAGRVRRQQILDAATTLFARQSYSETSLRGLADSVGITKSALFHHFATKEELLKEVLIRRDASIDRNVEHLVYKSPRDGLRDLPVGARANALKEPGLIELYVSLSCEAIPGLHAAHEYFADRYSRSAADLTAAFEATAAAGELPQDRVPEQEAILLLAVWEGLQIQWLYDRASVDVAAALVTHLDDVLPSRRG